MPGMPALSRLGPPGPAAIPAPGADASCGREPSMEYMIWGAGAVHDNSWPPQPLADADADRTDPSEIVLPPLHSSNRDSHDVFGELYRLSSPPRPSCSRRPTPSPRTWPSCRVLTAASPVPVVRPAHGARALTDPATQEVKHLQALTEPTTEARSLVRVLPAIPTSMLGLFSIRDGESTKRRHTTQSGREKAAKVRKTGSCLACYLGHKEVSLTRPVSRKGTTLICP